MELPLVWGFWLWTVSMSKTESFWAQVWVQTPVTVEKQSICIQGGWGSKGLEASYEWELGPWEGHSPVKFFLFHPARSVYPSTVCCALQQSKTPSPDEFIHLPENALTSAQQMLDLANDGAWVSAFYSLSPPRLHPGVSAHKRNSCQPFPVLCSPVICFIS